jgi:hypothetical protein
VLYQLSYVPGITTASSIAIGGRSAYAVEEGEGSFDHERRRRLVVFLP